MWGVLFGVELPSVGFDPVAIHDAGEALFYRVVQLAIGGFVAWLVVKMTLSWLARAKLGGTKPLYGWNDPQLPLGSDLGAFARYNEQFREKRQRDFGL